MSQNGEAIRENVIGAGPTRLPSLPHPQTNPDSTDNPPAQSPRRPVLNRKASGLKFNQRTHQENPDFTFEKVIGSYRIVKKIGKGRFGLVKLGEHVSTGVQVAIKIVDKSGLNVVESNSIKTEAEVMTCLNHANVVRLLEVIETKYELALIMEYAAGGDLFEYVQQRRHLSEKETRRLFAQVIAGLAYCHRHFVVHRDIKAENILLDEQNNIRIGDWGFSSVYHPGLTVETACGSLDYAAPEVLTGLVSYGPSVDIWALGVLLFFMLTGRLPFTAANDFDVYQLIKNADYRCPKRISKECKALLHALLNPNAPTRISITEVEKSPWFTAEIDVAKTSSSSSPASSSSPTAPTVLVPPVANSFRNALTSNGSLTSAQKPTPSSIPIQPFNSVASGSVSAKRKKRSSKEKRSISDTKIEQSMHKLKASSASAHAPRSSKTHTKRTSAEKALANMPGVHKISADPFNTITEEDIEEEVEIDEHAYDDSPRTTSSITESALIQGGGIAAAIGLSSTPTHEATDYQIAAAAIALSITPPRTMPIIVSAAAAAAAIASPSSSALESSTTTETSGRKATCGNRTFNTEKTKQELAVSRFSILRLSDAQLEQLRKMPQFDILQVTTKTTVKDEALNTVVVATRSTSARKLLRMFEQNRRLFRWNSDTNFTLRTRSIREHHQKQQQTPPVTPVRSSFRAASAAAYEEAAMRSGVTGAPHLESVQATSSASAISSATSRHRRRTSASSKEGSDFIDGSSSSTHSPTQARRRKKSNTECPANNTLDSPAGGKSNRSCFSSSGGVLHSSPSRPPTLASSRNVAGPLDPTAVAATTASVQGAPPKGKLAKMHSWSQSEFDNAAPGTLKKQLGANPTAGSSSNLFKFLRSKRTGSKAVDDQDAAIAQPPSTASSARVAAFDSDEQPTSSIEGYSPPLLANIQPAPSSSPAKITSPKSNRTKSKRIDSVSSSPVELPTLAVTPDSNDNPTPLSTSPSSSSPISTTSSAISTTSSSIHARIVKSNGW